MKKNISITDVLSSFESGNVSADELESIIRDIVKSDNPKNEIDEIQYNEGGVVVILKDGQIIEIDIDWDEIILT